MSGKIENIITELDRLKKVLSRYEKVTDIPVIERDILLVAIREIYSELMQIPADLPKGKPSAVTMESRQPVIREPEITEPVELIPEDLPPKQKKQDHPKKESISIRKTDEKKKVKPEILGDKLQGDRQFVYDTLAEKAVQKDISSTLKSKPITSISSAIGINDKFKLIKDLFNGDSESYTKVIARLESCNDFNEAFNFISTSFNWDMEDESVQFILDLVRRKFIPASNE